jgi:MarR family transcriptional regulator for hemolysin
MSYAGRKGASTSRLRTGSQPPSSLNLKRQLIAQIVQSSLLLREYMDHCAKVHGTTRAQWTVLIQLRQQEGRSQADLADILGLQPISLVRLLDRIMQHELLERRADHMDRRINRLYLTSKGRELVDDLDSLHDSIATDVLGEIPTSSISSILETLRDIKDRIKGFSRSPVPDGASNEIGHHVRGRNRLAHDQSNKHHHSRP